MGHVDHGKTTILDYLRKSSVAASEAGGITQHIGAFSVDVSSRTGSVQKITFLDTPGHAAFSKIRERGANATDIVVLVVAADDGIMAQTIESIQYAQAAGVAVVVAINKCDKFGPECVARVKESLLRHQIVCEDFGGDVQAVGVSGLTGLNMDQLLDALIVQGEMLELRADPLAPIRAVVIESRMRTGLGECATVLVQQGTLRVGALVVAEEAFCRIKHMADHAGRPLCDAPPSMPVEVAGWRRLPAVGAAVQQVASEAEAAQIVARFEGERVRAEKERVAPLLRERKMLHDRMWELVEARTKDPTIPPRPILDYEQFSTAPDARPKLPIIVKCDVIGSSEAVCKIVDGIQSKKVRVEMISSFVGPVTETDVGTAKAFSGSSTTGARVSPVLAKILAFNLSTPRSILKLAKREAVDLQQFSVIYRLTDYIKQEMLSLLPAEYGERQVGSASVLQLFFFDGDRKVAGCRVDDGALQKSNERLADKDRFFVRLTRGGKPVYEGRIHSMRHVKQEITSAGKGMECGVVLDGRFDEILPGDRLLCYERHLLERNL